VKIDKNIYKPSNSITMMNKWFELLLGLILVILAVIAWIQNIWGMGTAALELLKGGIVWFILFIGLLFILLGLSDLKG